MHKELLELLNRINGKKQEVASLANEGKLEEAAAAKEELKTMQEKFDLLKDVLDPEGNGAVKPPENAKSVKAGTEDAVKAFAEAARSGFRNETPDTMVEGTPEKGGYTVPEDIQTKINEYRDAKASLLPFVDTETVTAPTGKRTFKKRAQQTGFTKVAEGGAIGARQRRSSSGFPMKSKSTPGTFR